LLKDLKVYNSYWHGRWAIEEYLFEKGLIKNPKDASL